MNCFLPVTSTHTASILQPAKRFVFMSGCVEYKQMVEHEKNSV